MLLRGDALYSKTDVGASIVVQYIALYGFVRPFRDVWVVSCSDLNNDIFTEIQSSGDLWTREELVIVMLLYNNRLLRLQQITLPTTNSSDLKLE